MEMTQQEIESQLLLATEKRKTIETRLKDTQQELSRLQQMFEADISELKVSQTQENNLQEQLYEAQKTNIKQAISVDSLKKIFGDATPFFSKIRDKTLSKVQEMKDFLDGTSLDKMWVEERYAEYKDICIEKGEDIKSKEEFEKIALAIKEAEQLGPTSFYEKVGNVSREVGHAKNTIKSVWQSLKVEEKIGNLLKNEDSSNQITEINLAEVDKKTVFSTWVDTRNVVQLSKTNDTNTLHKDYVQYVEHVYGKDNVDSLTYSFKNGVFTNTLNKTLKSIEQLDNKPQRPKMK